jgi:hypothetical protein
MHVWRAPINDAYFDIARRVRGIELLMGTIFNALT